jgi:uncharacterized protein YkwD
MGGVPKAIGLALAIIVAAASAGGTSLAATAARDHSRDMESLHFFAHESPVEGKKMPWDRALRFNTTAQAENIVMGVHDGRDANEAWFHSPGHHKNMLGEHVRVGVGCSGVYFTEMFGG